MSEVKSDIQIAREAKMQPINDILAKINVPDESSAFSPMGRHIAKINLEYLETEAFKVDGRGLRGSIMIVGPLLARFGKGYIPNLEEIRLGADA